MALEMRFEVGPRRWSAVIVGLVGVSIVVGRTGNIGNLAAILAVLAALTYAGQTIITRYAAAYDRPWTMSLYSMMVFLVGSALASLMIASFGSVIATDHPSLQFLLRPWVVPAATDLMLMVFLGVNAAVGFYCLTKAYWIAPVSVIAPFEYTYIIWAVLFGFLIWSEVPAVTTFIGLALLIGSSLYILRRELRARNI